MRKLFPYLALLGLSATMVALSSCASAQDLNEPQDALDAISDTIRVEVTPVVATIEDLPDCDTSTQRSLYFVIADSSFQYCNGLTYSAYKLSTELPFSSTCEMTGSGKTKTITCTDGTTAVVTNGTDGKDGVNGEEGADGKDGTAGEAGAPGSVGPDGKPCTLTDDGLGTIKQTCGAKVTSWSMSTCYVSPIAMQGDGIPPELRRFLGMKAELELKLIMIKEMSGTESPEYRSSLIQLALIEMRIQKITSDLGISTAPIAIPYDPTKAVCSENQITSYCGERKFNPVIQFCDERDFQVYDFTVVGEQAWMAENLNYELSTTIGSPDFDNSTENVGLFYTYEEATSSFPLCPVGWSLPTVREWNELGASVAKMVGTGGIYPLDAYFAPSNIYGLPNIVRFNAYPYGYYDAGDAAYVDIQNSVHFWTADEKSKTLAYSLFGNGEPEDPNKLNTSYSHPKEDRLNVRCVRDASSEQTQLWDVLRSQMLTTSKEKKPVDDQPAKEF